MEKRARSPDWLACLRSSAGRLQAEALESAVGLEGFFTTTWSAVVETSELFSFEMKTELTHTLYGLSDVTKGTFPPTPNNVR